MYLDLLENVHYHINSDCQLPKA